MQEKLFQYFPMCCNIQFLYMIDMDEGDITDYEQVIAQMQARDEKVD